MNHKQRREQQRMRHGPPSSPVRRKMAAWEWLIVALLLAFASIQLFLRLTGRPGSTVPHWVDAPPYFSP